MAFCSKATKAIKKVWNEIDEALGKAIEEITKYTALIKALEANPAIDAIIKIIPGGSKVEEWLNVAIDEITGVTDSAKTLAEKISEWLSEVPTEYDRNMKLNKLASVAAKVADVEAGNAQKSERVYDAGTLLRILADKH